MCAVLSTTEYLVAAHVRDRFRTCGVSSVGSTGDARIENVSNHFRMLLRSVDSLEAMEAWLYIYPGLLEWVQL
jgi:hypothetical protein